MNDNGLFTICNLHVGFERALPMKNIFLYRFRYVKAVTILAII